MPVRQAAQCAGRQHIHVAARACVHGGHPPFSAAQAGMPTKGSFARARAHTRAARARARTHAHSRARAHTRTARTHARTHALSRAHTHTLGRERGVPADARHPPSVEKLRNLISRRFATHQVFAGIVFSAAAPLLARAPRLPAILLYHCHYIYILLMIPPPIRTTAKDNAPHPGCCSALPFVALHSITAHVVPHRTAPYRTI